MIFIDNEVNLYSLFIKIDITRRREIHKFIDFLKTNPDIESFKKYDISPDSFEIFVFAIEELLNQIS